MADTHTKNYLRKNSIHSCLLTYKKSKNIEENDQNGNELKSNVKVPEFSSVDELSKILGVSSSDIIAFCLELGTLATINQRLDWDVIELVSSHFEFNVEKLAKQAIKFSKDVYSIGKFVANFRLMAKVVDFWWEKIGYNIQLK